MLIFLLPFLFLKETRGGRRALCSVSDASSRTGRLAARSALPLFVASPSPAENKERKMRSSTLCMAALVVAAALSSSSLTGALAAAYDQAAPLAAAGTTPNNLTGAGALFGNKYQGDVSWKKKETEKRREKKKRFPMRDARWRKERRRRREKKTQPRPPFSLFLSVPLSLPPPLWKKNSRAPTTATTAAQAPAPTNSPGSTASRGSTASLTEWP